MQKWEYKWFDEHNYLFNSEKAKDKRYQNGTMNADEFLALLGRNGWELVAVLPHYASGEARYFFKRLIEK